jgi:hypothetical protein
MGRCLERLEEHLAMKGRTKDVMRIEGRDKAEGKWR